MPSKKKTKREDWYECMICGRIVHRLDISSHQQSCKSGQPIVHGFIKDGVLHATVSSQALSDAIDLPTCKEQHVLMHPASMLLCDLQIGQLCILNDSHVLRAWPNTSLHPVSVVLPKTSILQEEIHFEAGNLVTVQIFKDAGRIAEEVEIEIRTLNDIFLKDEFLQYLSLKMEGKYIMQGSVYTVQYFGISCSYCIKKLQVELPVTYPFEMKLSAPNESVLCQDLSALNISGVSDPKDILDVSTSSTPLRISDFNLSASSMLSPKLQTPEKCFERAEYFQTPTIHQSGNKSEMDFNRFAKVNAQTKFVLSHFKGSISNSTTEKKITFDCIGGLDKQIKSISETFQVCPQRSDLLTHYGDPRPRGILLFGPRGTGKTMLAKAIANEMSLFSIYISGCTELLSKFYGETEKKLKDIFQLAAKRSPSLIIFDELDRLCPSQANTHSDLEKRVATTLLTLLDGLSDKESKVVCYVLGITSKPDSIDPALRRAGRLDYEIETSVPSAAERLLILKAHLHDVPHNISETDLKAVSDAAHGFVGADLTALLKKAKLCAVRRLSQKEGMMHVLTCEDLLLAAKQISPSAMREVQLEVPEVKWEDIGGQAEIKLKLQQAVQWPLQHPESFTRLGISPPRGVLLYGPPGCSKTMIAKALATESGLNFLAVKGPELFTKWVGESERAVREVFRKARAAAPSIIFFDEIDVLAVERGSSGGTSNVADRVLTQLLTEIDGIERLQGVTIVAATNRPDMIDKAFLRPGRIDRILYVPLPDFSTRREILQISVRKMPLAEDVVLDDLAKQTEQYSGAELTAVCNEAALSALQEDINCERVALRHFNIALATVKPGISAEMLHFYENYSKKSGLHFV
ncbi:spermatogenesis-associated protein 5-like isoform X2 [Pomacea canaliculata]|nr:spermatogenesis-associated protein 5-like isoform X2 [Pomacea canaliculata]